jgi:carbon monoxide dehydrogenase subunit G
VELQHTFTVPAPVEAAWATLLDVEGIAPCFPGAALTSVDGDEFAGTVKVKLGPVSLQYAGKGRFVERDEAGRRVTLEANGSDKRGNGTAGATVHARLEPAGDAQTRVIVDTDLKVTGRPAQFGRGVLQDVGGRIIEQFATCLATRMTPVEEPAPPDGPAEQPVVGAPADVSAETIADELDGAPAGQETPPAPTVVPPAPQPQAVPASPAAELDLGAVVLPTLLKRYGPGALAGLVAVLVVWLARRRSR